MQWIQWTWWQTEIKYNLELRKLYHKTIWRDYKIDCWQPRSIRQHVFETANDQYTCTVYCPWGLEVTRVDTNANLAPVPLTRFRSNSKFDHIWQCSGFKCALPITTKFCTCHDSVTVVTCAKFRCDWLSIFQTRALPILLEFRIRSKYR